MKRLLISTAIILAMGSAAVGCGKKPEPAKPAASATASTATPAPTPGISKPEDVAVEFLKLVDKADGAAAVKFLYIPEKSKATLPAAAGKKITDSQAKGMLAAMGEPVVSKVVYFETFKGNEPVPVKAEEAKVGTLCQVSLGVKLTKDLGDKKTGSVMDIDQLILVNTEEGWKVAYPEDKETQAFLMSKVKK